MVNHSENFKVTISRGEITREVHTNHIEGYWGGAKSKFKYMRGTSVANVMSHLVEAMYKSHNKGKDSKEYIKIYFQHLRCVYPLNRDPIISAKRLFDLEDIDDLQLV